MAWPLSTFLALVTAGCDLRMRSTSMEPTIRSNETVRLDYAVYALSAPKRWDVVAFEPPTVSGEIWLFRVVALPGETVSFAAGGITINGRPLALPPQLSNVTYVSLDHPALRHASSSIASPYVVSPRSYFLLGDSSSNAFDSRFLGAIPMSNIVGRVRGK